MFSTGLRDEFADCKFGDARLDKRILKIADGLEGNPNRSIPAALLRHSDWTACYRFFDNDSVQPSKILSSHYKATLERISEYETVVMAHDSTEFDLTRLIRRSEALVYWGMKRGEAFSITQRLPSLLMGYL